MTRAGSLARARFRDPGGQQPHTMAGPPTGTPAMALAAAGLAVAWLAAGPTTALMLAAAIAGWTIVARVRAAAGGRRRRTAQFPAALDRLATSLRSGASLPTALDEAAAATPPPLGPELAALFQATGRGRPLVAVLDDWSARHDDRSTRLAATALVLATRVGSAPARAVDGVAATLRERIDLAAERRALATQARVSTLVLAAAPLAFAVVLVAGDAAAANFLLHQPAGWACLTMGLGLDALGGWWMARLTRGDEP